MNHDMLGTTFHTTLLSIYKVLLDEYKNEEIAKKNTLKIAKEVLIGFGMKGDISSAYNKLSAQYEKVVDEQEKYEIYKKLNALQTAIGIIKEVN